LKPRHEVKAVFRLLVCSVVLSVVGHIQGSPSYSVEASGPADERLPAIVTHDNRRPAGDLEGGVLVLTLRAGIGLWRPEGDAGQALRVEAFGEVGRPLSVPAPLIRVPVGTEIIASIKNELVTAMRVHGLCEHAGTPCAPIDVPAGETREMRFKSDSAGTYHYWATTTGVPQAYRAADDTQLSGAFIVDESGASPDDDRVFVITDWTSLTRQEHATLMTEDDPGATFLKKKPDVRTLINGRGWPHTERLTYTLGTPVHWRIVNLSTQVHPMHLHGFYFEIDSVGDGVRHEPAAADARQSVVTHVMPPGSTLGMTWTPERAGNWLFHCHVMTHVSPTLHVDGSPKANAHDHHSGGDHLSAGMSGMVMGITVTAPEGTPASIEKPASKPARKMTLMMRSERNRFGNEPAMGFVLAERAAPPAAATVPVPGPTLVLKRGEPVEITLVNQLAEGTAIHWHGMELDSYYDGVHGWGGNGQRVTPMIEPGGSFVVRFTPPRTGTFMYHTHLHDQRQLTSGLYGAMLVLEPDDTFDESTDHVFVAGRAGRAVDGPTVINGEAAPRVVWKAGVRHRVRLINITPGDIFTFTLQSSQGPVTWRPLTKDGAPVPPSRRESTSAKQMIGVGETYDFEYDAPPGRQTLWLEVRSPGGKWQAQGHIIVK
jgi:FtsP/CotA-like multicopper oxidase with cupredoxin domain